MNQQPVLAPPPAAPAKPFKTSYLWTWISLAVMVISIALAVFFFMQPDAVPEAFTGDTPANTYVTVDADYVWGPFATYGDANSSKYDYAYFFFGIEDRDYVVKVSYGRGQEIEAMIDRAISNGKFSPSDNLTFKGNTKRIPSDILDFAIENFNDSYETTVVNKSNYADYFGAVMIDTQSNPGGEGVAMCLVAFVALFVMIVNLSNNSAKKKKEAARQRAMVYQAEMYQAQIQAQQYQQYAGYPAAPQGSPYPGYPQPPYPPCPAQTAPPVVDAPPAETPPVE